VIFVVENMAMGHVFKEFGFLLSEAFHQNSIFFTIFMFLSDG
jgi:hypothetical protein